MSSWMGEEDEKCFNIAEYRWKEGTRFEGFAKEMISVIKDASGFTLHDRIFVNGKMAAESLLAQQLITCKS